MLDNTCNTLKIVYSAEIMHDDSQIKAENINIIPIYMYAMLELGIYSPYKYIYIRA